MMMKTAMMVISEIVQAALTVQAFSLASLDKKLPSFRGAGTSARQRRGQEYK